MKSTTYKELFDISLKDLKLMTNLIYEWSGITIFIKVIKYNKIEVILSILPQIASNLFGHLLKNYKIDHIPGFVKVFLKSQNRNQMEIYKIHEIKGEDTNNVNFNLSFYWRMISQDYIFPGKRLDYDSLTLWKLVDRSYIDQNKYRAISRKMISSVDYDTLIPIHFLLIKRYLI